MSTRQEDTQHAAQDKQERRQLNAVIGKQVLGALGQPGGLLGTQVRPLWQDHYRVNVFVGVDAASAKVAHSYFLVVDSDGNIIALRRSPDSINHVYPSCLAFNIILYRLAMAFSLRSPL